MSGAARGGRRPPPPTSAFPSSPRPNWSTSARARFRQYRDPHRQHARPNAPPCSQPRSPPSAATHRQHPSRAGRGGMSPASTAAPAPDVLSAETTAAFAPTVLAGVIVSLVTLWLAGRQRATQERQAEARRREAVLAAIGRELRWNRIATRGKLQASNAHITVGALATVAFERHADELATIAPQSIETVYKHYGLCRHGARRHPRSRSAENLQRRSTPPDLDRPLLPSQRRRQQLSHSGP